MKALHIKSPLLESVPLSNRIGIPVFLKMDNLQPSSSFKIRGIGLLCQRKAKQGAEHFISSSGGNAGLAVAFAGRKVQKKVTVIVPKTTLPTMREKLESEGAVVNIVGSVWDEAHEHALKIAKKKGCAYIHPFDDPVIWEGHSTIIQEIAEQRAKPGGIVVAVGGGGLLCGVLQGLHNVGWTDIPVFSAETQGAASLAAAIKAKKLVTLDKIETIATTLGARRVAAQAWKWAKKYQVIPIVVSDKEALNACLSFADDHRMLVEPACGAALAAVYENRRELAGLSSVLVIVCGGAGVTLKLLSDWTRCLA